MTADRRNDNLLELLRRLVKDLNRLQPEYSSSDRGWQIPMRTGERPRDWAMAHITHHERTYYFSWTASRLQLELNEKGEITESAAERSSKEDQRKLACALNHFGRHVHLIEKDWVRVYRETLRDYPLAMRYGIVPKSVIWKYHPDFYRVDAELGKARTTEFIRLARAPTFRDRYEGHHPKMSLALFTRYCKTAYLANADRLKGAVDKEMSGLEMYRRFADGRDEGLTELPLDSEDAFNQWYHSARGGGHPWEIYRGGNTTHIDLGVIEKHKGWSVFLRGSSTVRMAETVRIALALTEAGLPVEIHDAEKLVVRLLGMDSVGIIPEYLIIHRAAQDFAEGDQVFDCVHLRDLPRRNRILPFVTWKPMSPLRPLWA